MSILPLKSAGECGWDLASLGEILLRFDPVDERIHNARNFRVWDGGAEYNVVKNLTKVFHQETTIVTALADNSLGRLAEDFVRQGGVDVSNILWREADGKGGNTRNGIYFIERGFGLRVPDSCFDRAYTAVSQLQSGEINWQKIFGENGARWFHTGGIFVGLSETTPDVALEAMQIAKQNGTIISFDLNYRDSLWKNRGGKDFANNLNRTLLPVADIVFGAFDFDSSSARFDEKVFRASAEKMLEQFPNLKIVASTLREVHSASRHDFSAVCYSKGKVFKAQNYENIEILDRVGSGDAFASGFIYGLLNGKDAQFAVECGAAHGVLTMTTIGDNSNATLGEIERLMSGGGANVRR